MVEFVDWPWQYNFPPFFTIQTNADTLKSQLAIWRQLVVDYMKKTNQCILDIRETSKTPLFRNAAISRRLPEDGILVVMKDLARSGHAEAFDKSQTRWYVFWEPLEQMAANLHKWAIDRGMTNNVCTLYELSHGEDTSDASFHGLDEAVLEKALKKLELEQKAELFEFDNSKGVKFF